MLNAEFRKVKGHNGDPWNDAVDALAVIGRNEAIDWPKCSFEIVMQGGQIPFPKRAIRKTTGLQDPCKKLSQETHIKIPSY
jgi:hypothetical protein